MAKTKFILPGPETVTISGQTIDKLLRAGDGDAALLYLYILKTRGQGTSDEAAEALEKSAGGIAAAMEVLSRLGLIKLDDDISGDGPAAPQIEAQQHTDLRSAAPQREAPPHTDPRSATPQREAPQHTDPRLAAPQREAQPAATQPAAPQREAPPNEPRSCSIDEIRQELTTGSAFSSVVDETQRSLGKILSPDELQRLFGIYDGLRLPAEVIMLLLTHCISESRRSGGGRMPSMRYIEKAAYTWEREEIFSLDKAEEYLKAFEASRSARGEIKRTLQINDREFSATEKRYVDGWIENGFTAAAVEIAYDRTVIKTGKPDIRYMNGIMSNWHSRNLHTPKEILEKDGRSNGNGLRKDQKDSGQKFGAPDQEELLRMERLLKKIKEE